MDTPSTITDTRAFAEHALREPLPDFILEVVGSEVLYHLSPSHIPIGQMAFETLASSLKETYRLAFEGAPELKGLLSQIDDSTHRELIPQLLKRGDFSLTFGSGGYLYQDGLLPIDEVRIDSETVFVKGRARTEVLEHVAIEVLGQVWNAASIPNVPEDLPRKILLKTFGTGTKVSLGGAFETMLAPDLVAFVNDRILSGPTYVRGMGSRSPRNSFDGPPTIAASFTLDELHLNFHRFDTQTGRTATSRLRLGVMTRDEQGTGTVLVASETDFRTHCELVSDLRRTLGKSAAKNAEQPDRTRLR